MIATVTAGPISSDPLRLSAPSGSDPLTVARSAAGAEFAALIDIEGTASFTEAVVARPAEPEESGEDPPAGANLGAMATIPPWDGGVCRSGLLLAGSQSEGGGSLSSAESPSGLRLLTDSMAGPRPVGAADQATQPVLPQRAMLQAESGDGAAAQGTTTGAAAGQTTAAPPMSAPEPSRPPPESGRADSIPTQGQDAAEVPVPSLHSAAEAVRSDQTGKVPRHRLAQPWLAASPVSQAGSAPAEGTTQSHRTGAAPSGTSNLWTRSGIRTAGTGTQPDARETVAVEPAVADPHRRLFLPLQVGTPSGLPEPLPASSAFRRDAMVMIQSVPHEQIRAEAGRSGPQDSPLVTSRALLTGVLGPESTSGAFSPRLSQVSADKGAVPTQSGVADVARDTAMAVARTMIPEPLDAKSGRRHLVAGSGPEAPTFPEGPAGLPPPGVLEAVRPAVVDGPATTRDVARQIAVQPVLQSGGSAELHLAPEELGQLRLSVESAGDGLRVTIEALRPETADLLRRHIEVLRQELRQDGLGAVSVSIAGGETGRGNGPPLERGDPALVVGPGADGVGPAAGLTLSPPRPRPAAGQLDLRV